MRPVQGELREMAALPKESEKLVHRRAPRAMCTTDENVDVAQPI